MSSGTTPAEVLANLNKVKETAKELKKKETRLLTDIVKYAADRVKAVLNTGMNTIVYRAVQVLELSCYPSQISFPRGSRDYLGIGRRDERRSCRHCWGQERCRKLCNQG